MNKEDRIIKILEEMRDIMKAHFLPVQKEQAQKDIRKSNSMSDQLSDWDEFLESKKTENPYYIVALAVYYLTNGDVNENVKKKDLESFLEESTSEMKGRNIGRDIEHANSMYGYIDSAGYGKYKIDATTKRVVKTLPDEDSLKSLPKKYQRGGRKRREKKAK